MLCSKNPVVDFRSIKIPLVTNPDGIAAEKRPGYRNAACDTQKFMEKNDAAVTEQVAEEIIFRVNKFYPVKVIWPCNM